MAEKIKLNLGAGPNPLEGYTNLDIAGGCDVRSLDEYDDGTVDEVRASHILEHFGHQETQAVLQEWVRVLKPGGRLRVAVPDGLNVMRSIVAAADGEIETDTGTLTKILLGGQTDEYDRHGAVFDERGLKLLLHRAGLINIKPWRGTKADCSGYSVSLNLQGTKPVPWESVKQNSVHMLMSVPRLGWTKNFSCCASAAYHLKLPLHTVQGAYYGQVMQNAMEGLLGIDPEAAIADGLDPSCAENIEYIVTVDYDSVFTPEDVRTLLSLMESHKDVSVLAALQSKRGGEDLLFSVGKREVPVSDFEADVMDVKSAHFGLTVIRVSDLRDVPRPWFHGHPNEDGSFKGKGAIDPDLAFWKCFRDKGKRLCLAPNVPIGHLEEVIMWPGWNLRPIHQQMQDYRENGMPEGVHK